MMNVGTYYISYSPGILFIPDYFGKSGRRLICL